MPGPIPYCVSSKPSAKLSLYKYYHTLSGLPLVFLHHCHQYAVTELNKGLSFETSLYWLTENLGSVRDDMY